MSIKSTLKTIYRHTAPWHASRSHMTMVVAQQILSDYTPDPFTTCLANNYVNPRYDLQIIVPAYNAERFVAEALESVLTQKTKYSYIISVVNDGSTDKTPEILRSYEMKYSDRMEVINQENRGFSGARNAALKVLKGRYITFLDSDDVMAGSAVETLLDKADGKDIIQGGWYTFEQSGGVLNKKRINSRGIHGESFLRPKSWSILSSRKDIGLKIRRYLLYFTEPDTVRRSFQMWFMAID